MDNFTISVFSNKIFFEIIKEIKLFSEYKIKYYENLDLFTKDSPSNNPLIVFFDVNIDESKIINFPSILVTETLNKKNKFSKILNEEIKMPFKIKDFEKKVILLSAKYKFKKNSFINLNGYIIDKNERKIKKDKLELQLSEKEVNFLILFGEYKDPVSRAFLLKNAWKYSAETETHTVETHIHRIRKKIFEKFNDNNFIKNNNKGYYI